MFVLLCLPSVEQATSDLRQISEPLSCRLAFWASGEKHGGPTSQVKEAERKPAHVCA